MTSKQLRCTVIITIAVYCYEHAGDDGNGHDHFSEWRVVMEVAVVEGMGMNQVVVVVVVEVVYGSGRGVSCMGVEEVYHVLVWEWRWCAVVEVLYGLVGDFFIRRKAQTVQVFGGIPVINGVGGYV